MHRQASQGAGITLVSGCGEYQASFECASRIASILGTRRLQETADGIYESAPVYKIPVEEMFSVCGELSKKFSIALIDLVLDKNSTRFVLVWKINSKSSEPDVVEPPEPVKPTFSLDEF